jgi:cytochrome oxidase assembly protein ShyY1
MLLLLVLLLGAAAVCARLGVWQLDRAQLRGDVDERAEQAELAGAPADPIAEVVAPQTRFSGELVGHKVRATGTFDADPLLVAGRALDGRVGFLLLDPLRVVDAGSGEGGAGEAGSADGGASAESTLPVLPVVRGWVESPAAAAALDPAPSGTVVVTGYLQGGEAGGDGGLPAGQIDAVSPAELVNRWGGPIYSGYLVLTEMSPPQDPGIALLPPPSVPGGGLNIQNLAYALQWWIFGAFALLLWARLVRDEAREPASE